MFDAIVVGAGVIGMLTARELWKSGWQVAIVERDQAGQGASWAGGGIIAPLRPWAYSEAIWQLVARSRVLYPDLGASLHSETGIDPEVLACGAYLLDDSAFDAAQAWHEAHDLPCALDTTGPAGGTLRMPWVQQVRNPRLCAALRSLLLQEGVRLYEGTPVMGMVTEGDVVRGVETASGMLRARHVVNAAGAWSGRITGDTIKVEPVRGQMLLVRSESAQPAGIWLLPEAYVIVRADGCTLIGSTVEHVGFDRGTTSQARHDLLAHAKDALPWLRTADVLRQWSGLRPATSDGCPVIAPDANWRGLWWHTGHFRNGIAMGPASAERLVAMMTAA